MASTHSPIFSFSLLPTVMGCRFLASILIKARSVSLSCPMIRPLNSRLSFEFYQNLVSIFHNVVVGDDISVGCEDNSRAGSATFGRLTRLLLARCALAEKISEEVFEGVEVLHVLFGSRGGNLYVDDRVKCFVGRNRQIDGLRRRTALCGRGNRSGRFGAFHCHCFRCCANSCGKKESRNDFHVHMYSFIGLF